MPHHPSCKPSDSTVILKCYQCGIETPFEDILNAAKKVLESLEWEEKRSGCTYDGYELLRATVAKAECREPLDDPGLDEYIDKADASATVNRPSGQD